jgi:hypothetical protein
MKEPVDHILRPQLPWRQGDGAITECGYDAAKVKTLTREKYFQRLQDMGQQRAALFTCMTCADTAKRWGAWDDDPGRALDREIAWECGGSYWCNRDDRGFRLRDELFAIAALIAAHRDEFDALMSVNMQRRNWLLKKADLENRKTRRSKERPRGLWDV